MRFDFEIPITAITVSILADEIDAPDGEAIPLSHLRAAIAQELIAAWEDQLLDLDEMLQSDQQLRRAIARRFRALSDVKS